MPESDTGQERTIPLTPRRRQQLREEGNVPKSQEVNSVLVLLVGLLVFYFLARTTFLQFGQVLIATLEGLNDWTFDRREALNIFVISAWDTFRIMLPYLLLIMVAAVLANLLQVGFLLSGKPLQPRLDRISPIQGFKRIFSMRGVMEMFKSTLKIGLVGLIAWLVIRNSWDALARSVEFGVWQQLLFLGDLAARLAFYSILALLLLALIDLLFQRFQFERQHRMTQEELKRELRETEGDPHLRARIRQIQRDMSRRRMMAEVPRADVVVTNPTHYAVALRYRSVEGEAPFVLAKGRGHLALRIREIAEEHEIPIVENPPLAQALYKACDPGMEIPEDLYTAVAEVLAYVHRMGQLSENLVEAGV